MKAVKKWCLDLLEAAIDKNRKPEIINQDQGSHYTSHARTQYWDDNEIKYPWMEKGALQIMLG